MAPVKFDNGNVNPQFIGKTPDPVVFNNPEPVVGQEEQVTVNRTVPTETTEGKTIVETSEVTPKETTETTGFEDSLSSLIDEVAALNTGGDKKAFSYEVATAIEKLKEAQVLLNNHSKVAKRKEAELKVTELHQVQGAGVRDEVIGRQTVDKTFGPDNTVDNAPFDNRLGNRVIDKPIVKGTDQL